MSNSEWKNPDTIESFLKLYLAVLEISQVTCVVIWLSFDLHYDRLVARQLFALGSYTWVVIHWGGSRPWAKDEGVVYGPMAFLCGTSGSLATWKLSLLGWGSSIWLNSSSPFQDCYSEYHCIYVIESHQQMAFDRWRDCKWLPLRSKHRPSSHMESIWRSPVPCSERYRYLWSIFG